MSKSDFKNNMTDKVLDKIIGEFTMNNAILNNYQRWTERAIADIDVINELKDIAGNEEKIEDAFYKDLAFLCKLI